MGPLAAPSNDGARQGKPDCSPVLDANRLARLGGRMPARPCGARSSEQRRHEEGKCGKIGSHSKCTHGNLTGRISVWKVVAGD